MIILFDHQEQIVLIVLFERLNMHIIILSFSVLLYRLWKPLRRKTNVLVNSKSTSNLLHVDDILSNKIRWLPVNLFLTIMTSIASPANNTNSCILFNNKSNNSDQEEIILMIIQYQVNNINKAFYTDFYQQENNIDREA